MMVLLPAAALLACAAVLVGCSDGRGDRDGPAGPLTLEGYVDELSGLLDDANEAVGEVYIELFPTWATTRRLAIRSMRRTTSRSRTRICSRISALG